jgi:hypothetical protein
VLENELRQYLSKAYPAAPASEHEEFRYLQQPDSLLHITLRDFFPLKVGFEFRGFVRNKELCAISQYESGMYSEELQNENGEYLKSLIVQFYSSIKHLFYNPNFIIDFAIFNEKVYIVETSPWVCT